MTGPSAVMLAFMVVGIPTIVIGGIIIRLFKWREKKLEVEALIAAGKAAQFGALNHDLEDRVRVLEQIITDAGAQTAAQIEALRDPKALKGASRRRTSSATGGAN